jgi:hypothetical protein
MQKYILFIFMITSISLSDSNAQIIKTRLDFVGGLAYPEYLHVGARYRYADVAQVGFYYGGDMGLKPNIIRTWTADHMYHFGKHSYTSNRPVWYARQGFTYSVHTAVDFIYRYSYINLSVGREFGITDWLGFNADMGLLAQIRERKDFRGVDAPSLYNTKWDWGPILRLQVFISL